MEEDGNARDETSTQIQLFSGTRKGDVIAMKELRHEWSISLEILFGMLPLEAANTWAVNYSRIKTYTICQFDTSVHLNTKPEEPQRLLQRGLDISNHQDLYCKSFT